jgi:asparagine synthase (glutamine-hydrolysing)
MCGIAAFYQSENPDAASRLRSALGSMRHRGPDQSGEWLADDGRTGLGSTRLAVMGGDDGRQPLSNETGTVHAVVNGEFYDFERLRMNLEGKGHVFRTRADSELLVHLYEEHGFDCLRHLRGEFALVLWDDEKKVLFAARDRFGIKPLHVARSGNAWWFASEIKALLAAGVTASWDIETLRHCLVHQYPRADETLFLGVRQIPPASALVIDGQDAREFRYWQPSFDDQTIGADEIRALLEEAVALRMRCDVPVACALSGGVDSSAIAVIASSHRPVRCFSVAFEGPGYDESALLPADSTMVRVTRRDQALQLPAAVAQSEGLAINGQLVGKFMLSRAIHEAGFKVVLAGEGADEAFLGYAHLQHDAGFETDFSLQRGVMLPTAGESQSWEIDRWLPTFLRTKLATGRHLAKLMLEPPDVSSIVDGTLAAYDSETRGLSRPRQAAWLWTRLALAGYILRTLGDAAEMAHSVEARLPFLDHVLFERAARVSVGSLIDAGQTKILLREALRGMVPEVVRTRPKHPFLAPPLLSGTDAVIREFVADTLRSKHCLDLPLLDHAAVLRWSDSASDQARLDPVLMLLLTATLLNQTYHLS